MPSIKVRIRYDGPALADHSIDVDELASALRAISQLFKLTNGKFNQDRATITVLVNVNVEQNCFEFAIEILQALLSHAQELEGDEDIATPREMLDWLGLAGGAVLYRLLKAYKNIKDRKIEIREATNDGNSDNFQIVVKGDNNTIQNTFNVFPQTHDLLKESAIEENMKRLLQPLAKEGYEKIQIESPDGRSEEVTQEEAREILRSDISSQLDTEKDDDTITITTWVTVYSPVYEGDAKRWRFSLQNRTHVYIDISNTDIAERALKRGGALVDDAYKVVLEMKKKPGVVGKLAVDYTYKILEVIEFKPAELSSQTDAFD